MDTNRLNEIYNFYNDFLNKHIELCELFQKESDIENCYSSPLYKRDFETNVNDLRKALLAFFITDFMKTHCPNIVFKADEIIAAHDEANQKGFSLDWIIHYLQTNYIDKAESLSFENIKKDIRNLFPYRIYKDVNKPVVRYQWENEITLSEASIDQIKAHFDKFMIKDKCLLLNKYVTDYSSRRSDGSMSYSFSINDYKDFKAFEKALKIKFFNENPKTVTADLISDLFYDRRNTDLFEQIESPELEKLFITKMKLCKNGSFRIWFKDKNTALLIRDYFIDLIKAD